MVRCAPIKIKRHYHTLSEQETDEVIETVADLIVSYLKTNPGSDRPAASSTGSDHRRGVGGMA